MRKALRDLLLLPALALMGAGGLDLATPGVSFADTTQPIPTPAAGTPVALNEVSLAASSLNEMLSFSSPVSSVENDLHKLLPGNPTGDGCIRIALGICYYPDPGDLVP